MFGVKVAACGAGLNGAEGEVAPIALTSLTLFGFLTAPATKTNEILNIIGNFLVKNPMKFGTRRIL
jgi:hypothetical protein